MYANAFQEHIKKHPFVNHAHKHNFFLCVLFTKGSGTHEIDFVNYAIKPGTIFVLRPGQFHLWKLSEDIEGYIFFHSKDLYNQHYNNKKVEQFSFFSRFNNQQYFELSDDNLSKTTSLFENINAEFSEKNPLYESAIISLIDLVYTQLERESNIKIENTISPGYLEKLNLLEELIEQHYLQEKSASAYAGMMHITEKHLNRICKESLGRSLKQLIYDRVIVEAKRKLLNGNLPVSEIAEILGYTDVSYFTRMFKNYTNELPKDFRKR